MLLHYPEGAGYPQGNSCCRDECWVFGFPVKHFIIAGVLCPLSSAIGPALAAQPTPFIRTLNTQSLQQKDEPNPQSATPLPPTAPVPQSVQPQGPESSQLGPPAILIPRLSRGPSLDDFVTMKPAGEVAP